MRLRRIHDVQLLQVLEPAFLLPLLRDALQRNPAHDCACHLCDPVLLLGHRAIVHERPLTAHETDERRQRERGIATSRKYHRQDIDRAVCRQKRRRGDVLAEMYGRKRDLLGYCKDCGDRKAKERTGDGSSSKEC